MQLQKIVLAVTAALLMAVPVVGASTFEFEVGDVFVGGDNNQMGIYRGGVKVATLTAPGDLSYMMKPAFSAAGDAFVPHWQTGAIHVFDRHGVHQGVFATVPGAPESVDFDSSGNLFVGARQGIWKFDAFGTQTAAWAYGGDYITLDGDCTLYHTMDDAEIYKLDVCTSGATRTHFVTTPSTSRNSDIVATPSGIVVGTHDSVLRYDLAGTLLETYAPAGAQSYYALALDAAGTGFYTSVPREAQIHHVDIATGTSSAFAHTESGGWGLGVYGGARGPAAPLPELSTIALTGLGILAMAGMVLRQRKA